MSRTRRGNDCLSNRHGCAIGSPAGPGQEGGEYSNINGRRTVQRKLPHASDELLILPAVAVEPEDRSAAAGERGASRRPIAPPRPSAGSPARCS